MAYEIPSHVFEALKQQFGRDITEDELRRRAADVELPRPPSENRQVEFIAVELGSPRVTGIVPGDYMLAGFSDNKAFFFKSGQTESEEEMAKLQIALDEFIKEAVFGYPEANINEEDVPVDFISYLEKSREELDNSDE